MRTLNLRSTVLRADPGRAADSLRACRIIPLAGQAGVALLGYADVLRALADARQFSSDVNAIADPMLLGAEPIRHARTRAAFVAAFHQAAQTAQASVDRIADDLVRGVRDRAEIDLVAALAGRLPYRLISLMVTGAEESEALLRNAARRILRQAAGLEGGPASAPEFERLLDAVVTGPIGPLARALRTIVVAGELSDCEARGLTRLAVLAGGDTTGHLISCALRRMVYAPDAMEALRRAPQHLPDFVHQVLARDSPVQFVHRRAAQDVTVGQQTIPKGTRIVAWVGAANRDPARDSEGRRRPHLAFGAGRHRCVGGDFAVRQTVAGLRALLAHTRSIEPAVSEAAVPVAAGAQLWGPAALPVRVSWLNIDQSPQVHEEQ